MSKKNKVLSFIGMVGGLLCCFIDSASAGIPVWSISALTATEVIVSPDSIANIQYRVTNNSRKRHTLEMISIPGVTQVTTAGYCSSAFTLNYNESCVLSLLVQGSALKAPITGGPIICQQGGGLLECYRPQREQVLNVRIDSTIAKYTVGGRITGLNGSVVLQNNGADDLTLDTNDSFTFKTPITSGGTYNVTVRTNPEGQICNVVNDSGTMGTTNVTNIAVNCRALIAFITNNAGTTVSRCDVDNQTGDFSNCSDTGGVFDNPTAIAFNASGTRVFVSNMSSNTVSRCDVDSATGAFVNCSDTGGGPFFLPSGIVFNTSGTRAFVTNPIINTVSRCDVNSVTGAFSNCSDTGGTTFNAPSGIILNATDSRAFVANTGENSVSRCDIDESGDFSNCSNTGGTPFNSPFSLTLNKNGTRAFVTSAESSIVSRCEVDNATGAFSNCSNTGGEFSAPFGILLHNSGARVYVTNYFSDSVICCDVDAQTGGFSNCNDTGGTTFDGPFSIVLH